MNKRILIGGGGTGGHVFPAISIANALRDIDPGVDILFVGAKGKLEMEKVPEAGYTIEGLTVTGFQRRLSLKNLTFFLNLIKSSRMSAQIIKRFKPHVVIGVGGYASGPILRAASKAGIPILIQEQNSYAGITNRLLAKRASLICVAYEGMEKYFPAEKIIVTGNPVRKDITLSTSINDEGLKQFGLLKGKPVVLIIGGSLGAGTINQAMENALSSLPENIQFLWQTGKYYFEKAKEKLIISGRTNIVALPFIREMNLAYASADIIVSRAGAGTISELAVVGKPIILIPSPNVAEDHQTHNALALVEKDAAILIKDNAAAEKLVSTIIQLSQDEKWRRKLAENIKRFAIPDAADKIAHEIIKIAAKQ